MIAQNSSSDISITPVTYRMALAMCVRGSTLLTERRKAGMSSVGKYIPAKNIITMASTLAKLLALEGRRTSSAIIVPIPMVPSVAQITKMT